MSESDQLNSTNNTGNTFISLDQASTIMADQTQGGNPQQVMSLARLLNLDNIGAMKAFESVDFPESLKLESKINFQVWRNEILRYARGIGAEFENFVLNETPAHLYDLRLGNMLHQLLIRTVKEKVRMPRQELGKSGKELYLDLIKSFGTQYPYDKFEIVKYYWDQLTNPLINVKRRFEIEEVWVQYINAQTATEREVLNSFVWLHLSKSILPQEYLRSAHPVLDKNVIKIFLDTHPKCDIDQIMSFVNNELINYVGKNDTRENDMGQNLRESDLRESDLSENDIQQNELSESDSSENDLREIATKETVSELFENQCQNCFGLGHDSYECSLAFRNNQYIPDLFSRLQSFRGNRIQNNNRNVWSRFSEQDESIANTEKGN